MPPNRQVTLVARPAGEPKESDFALIETAIAEPAEGEVLVRTLWLSLDPYQRGRMSEAAFVRASRRTRRGDDGTDGWRSRRESLSATSPG